MEKIDVILHGKDIIFEEDEWREFVSQNEEDDYKISYKCKLKDKSQNKITTIGMIKVWSKKYLEEGEKIDLNDKNDFKRNKLDYYSIGSDTYYDNLKTIFGDDYKEILRYFNDISFIISENEKDDLKDFINRKLSEIEDKEQEITRNELKSIEKYYNDKSIENSIDNFSKDIKEILKNENKLLKTDGTIDEKINYIREHESILDKEYKLENIALDLKKIEKCFSEKIKISRELNSLFFKTDYYENYEYNQKMESFFDDPSNYLSSDDLKEKEDNHDKDAIDSYFDNIAVEQESLTKGHESFTKEEFNDVIKGIHTKNNVTYQFNDSFNDETSKINSNDGFYKVNLKTMEKEKNENNEENEKENALIKLCCLFVRTNAPSIRRIGDIGKPLYYACDSPNQVMVIDDGDLELNNLNNYLNDKVTEENGLKNKNTLYDLEYEYKKRNLFKKISLEQEVNIESGFGHLRNDDKDILINSLKESMDYDSLKKQLRSFEKNKDKDNLKKNSLTIDEQEMFMILKICSLVSRNMFLIISKVVSDKCLEVIKNIMKQKHSICIYIDGINQIDNGNDLENLSNYINREKGEKVEN